MIEEKVSLSKGTSAYKFIGGEIKGTGYFNEFPSPFFPLPSFHSLKQQDEVEFVSVLFFVFWKIFVNNLTCFF